jgi:hypothetical protein
MGAVFWVIKVDPCVLVSTIPASALVLGSIHGSWLRSDRLTSSVNIGFTTGFANIAVPIVQQASAARIDPRLNVCW